jgi:1-acyl-sn-glycerol-3-phosphate acyltransferase
MQTLLTILSWLGVAFALWAVAFAIWVAFLPGSIRPLFRVLLWPRYSVRTCGLENVPRKGPLMLVGNHVSWIDGFLVASVCPRSVTVLVNKDYCDNPGQRWLARRMNVIPIPASGPKAQRIALESMRKSLDEGRTVGLFPEAQLCRSGMMTPFLRGVEMILKDKPAVVVVPIGLVGIWGSFFSFSGGHFFNKWPKGWRRKIGIAFGPQLPSTVKSVELRRAVVFQMVKAKELIPDTDIVPEVIDFELGHWRHPDFGLLAGSVPDFAQPARRIRQIGNKPGSVGQVIPGLALRPVGASGEELPPDVTGRIELFRPGHHSWVDTGWIGKIDAEGFIWLEAPDTGFVTTVKKEVVKLKPSEAVAESLTQGTLSASGDLSVSG